MTYKYCPNYRVSLSSEKNNDYLVYKPRCKQWSCPYCAIVNRKIWRARIMSEVETTPAVKIWYFWTLTLLGKDHKGLKHSINMWRKNWQKLIKRIKRDCGKLRYCRVFEMHKDGTLHIHMLCDKSYDDCVIIPKTKKQKERRESPKLRKHLNKLKLGYIHDIKIIDTEDQQNNGIARNISAYIVKYMTKDSMTYARSVLLDMNSRLRVIQTSKGWYQEDKKDPDRVWKIEPIFKTTYMALPAHNTVTDVTTDRNITIDDFHDFDYYPNRTSDLLDVADIDST